MTTKAVAVFDIDDVFFPLNEHVAKIAQVDYDKIVTYCAMDNPLLNEADRRRLYQSYQTPGMHAKMDFYPGAPQLEIFHGLRGMSTCFAWDAMAFNGLSSNNNQILSGKRFVWAFSISRPAPPVPVLSNAGHARQNGFLSRRQGIWRPCPGPAARPMALLELDR